MKKIEENELEREILNSEAEETNKEKGASLVEYAILVALIVIVAIAAIRTVGTQVSTSFSGIASNLSSAN